MHSVNLGDLQRGFVLCAYCACGHRAEVDVARLAAAKGWDLDTTRIRRCLLCSACGSKDIEIRIVYDGGIKFRHGGMTSSQPSPA